MDKYTKVVLTLIAFALWANLAVSLAPHGLIRDANAQSNPNQISRVSIVSVETPLQVTLAGQLRPSAVYLTGDPTGAAPAALPVNLAQIGSKSIQQGAALPVDIEGIAGAGVKSSPGLPVALAQPVAVTAKDPLPVTARDPLAVSSKTPLQVIVTKLPVSPAVSQSPANQSSTGTTGSSSTSAPPGN